MDHYGIGNAIISAARMYFQTARGTGRTTSLIESLKSGDRVVFTNKQEADRVSRLCKERGVEIEIMIVDPKYPEKIFDRGSVLGVGRTIFDHSWVEQYYQQVLEQAEKNIDMFQRETSGHGMAHIETRLKAKNLKSWLPF